MRAREEQTIKIQKCTQCLIHTNTTTHTNTNEFEWVCAQSGAKNGNIR